MLIRELMHERFGKFSNEANWVYHNKYLAFPKHVRDRLTYQDYLINELQKLNTEEQ